MKSDLGSFFELIGKHPLQPYQRRILELIESGELPRLTAYPPPRQAMSTMSQIRGLSASAIVMDASSSPLSQRESGSIASAGSETPSLVRSQPGDDGAALMSMIPVRPPSLGLFELLDDLRELGRANSAAKK